MKKVLFLISILVLLLLFPASSFAADVLRNHQVSFLSQTDVSNGADFVFAGGKFFAAYTESLRLPYLSVSVIGPDGWVEDVENYKGIANNNNLPYGIRGSSDGTSAVFVWMEDDNFGVPHLFCLTIVNSGDTREAKVRQVDSQLFLSDADVVVSGSNVVVVYKIGNTVYEKRSSDSGNTFSSRTTVYTGDDYADFPYSMDLEISPTGEIGLALAVIDRFLDSNGDEAELRKVYYYSATFSQSFGSPTLLYGASQDADAPYEYQIWHNLSLAFDNNGNPWVAWLSRNQTYPKIVWRMRSGSVWNPLYTFTHQNSISSSIKLVRNRAYKGPGIVFFYTKGSNSSVYSRYAISSTSLSQETAVQGVDLLSTGYIDAEEFLGRFSVMTIGMPASGIYALRLWFRDALEPGRSFKKRYSFYKEGFESSDVNTDPLWSITYNPSAPCYFAETSSIYYSGSKSLWSAGIGNLSGYYRPNTDTSAWLKFAGLPGLSYEASFYFNFDNGTTYPDPDDLASAGFGSSLVTLPSTNLTWQEKVIVSSQPESMIGFRMISDSDSFNGRGLFVDDLKLYGYRLPRPAVQVEQLSDSVRFTVQNISPKRIYLFRSVYGSSNYSLVSESTSSSVSDSPPSSPNIGYSYFVVASDGDYESPPSELITVTRSYQSLLQDTYRRIGGKDRYLTAVELSKSKFSSAETVVIATGENFPDALSSAPLAAALRAPILLTKASLLPEAVVQEIQRLGASKAYIIGGTGVVSDSVKDRLVSLGLQVERIGGRDRYETSALIAEKIVAVLSKTKFYRVYIVTGENYPDALSISPVASSEASPILLVKKDVLPAKVSEFINKFTVRNCVIVGGEGVISKSVELYLPNSKRIYGANRYSTSLEIARFAYSLPWFERNSIYVATGENFPDALASGVCAVNDRAVLLLVRTNIPLWYETENFLSYLKVVKNVNVVGLEGAVSEQVVSRIMDLIR